MKIDVHCIGDDNSFYSPTDNALHMGDGGVDDAEDADVVIHEFGHATQANQLPGFGPGSNTQQRAMGEGFGDFLAAYTYLQDGNASYQAARRFCVAEWDATSFDPVTAPDDGSGCLRWVDGTDEQTGDDIGTYDPAPPNEEHADGRFWSAMLTCVFDGIEPFTGTAQARNRMLTLVLAHHFDLTPTAGNTAFADSLSALRAEDDARFNGDERGFLNTCGEQRLGIDAPADTTAPVVSGSLSPASPDGAGGWYRTAPAVSWSILERDSAYVRNGCQSGTDPADTPGKTITCSVTSEGGTTAKSLTYKKDGTAPTLAGALSSAAPKVGDAVTAAANATDATSGVATQSCGPVDTSTEGFHTVNCTATDTAGNAATQTLAYMVAALQTPPETTTTYRISKVKVARNGNLSFRLRASRSGRVRLSAKAGKVKFKSLNRRLTANKNLKFTLKLSTKARRAFLKKLKGGKKVKVKLTITPTTGKKVTFTLTVRRK
jgi:hypothetical protein